MLHMWRISRRFVETSILPKRVEGQPVDAISLGTRLDGGEYAFEIRRGDPIDV